MDGKEVMTLVAFLASVPFTQFFGLYIRNPRIFSAKHLKWKSLFGGIRYFIYTIVSWLSWLVSLVFATPVVSTGFPVDVPKTHKGVLYGASLALSIIGLILNIKALFVFEQPFKSKVKNLKIKSILSPDIGFAIVLFSGHILALISGFLITALDDLPDTPSRLLYCTISLFSSLIATGSTYGLGGFLRYCKGSKKRTSSWKFFQPFSGGKVFVTSQALGWTLFSISLVCIIRLMLGIAKGLMEAVRVWALASQSCFFITEIVLGISLFTFRPENVMNADLIFRRYLILLMIYVPVHMFQVIFWSTFMFYPSWICGLFWTIGITLYYVITLQGNPQQTGCRRWPAYQKFMCKHAETSLKNWFGHIEVIAEPSVKFDTDKKYVFGYHPHGLYPMGAGILQFLDSFQKLLNGHMPICLCASALFFPPILRDFLCWTGAREVSRKTFKKSLNEANSVLLCPGGQGELVETYRAHIKEKEVVICSRHKGFVRLAIENGACLVPIAAIGEIFSLTNAFNAPKLQKATYRCLGFPIPYLLVGKWRLLPIPNQVPLYFAIGTPIEPPLLKPGEKITDEMVDAFHRKFFESMIDLFNKYKDRHPLYSDVKIVLE